MPKLTQRLSTALIASLIVLGAAFVFSASTAQDSDRATSGPWHMIRVDSTYGYAYLYNSATGEAWQLDGKHRTRVVERKEGQ